MGMFLTEDKLGRRIDELKLYRYRGVCNLEEFQVKEDKSDEINPRVPAEFESWDLMKVGSYWEGRNRYLWMHKDITVPLQWIGKRAVGVFDFGKTGEGNNSGFESMFYLDGEPFQAVDSNHKEVFFEEKDYGRSLSITFRLWSGLEGGGIPQIQEHKLKTAFLGWLDEECDDLIYLSDMMLKTVAVLAESDPVRHKLLTALDEAFLLLNWTDTGSEDFYKSVAEADRYLNEVLDSMDKNSMVHVSCVGHTHIDVAWLWRLKNTREKASRSFATVLRLMEQYPEYIFLQTQPQLYEYIKEDFPELYEKIKEKVKEGRWEADGAMWVEADCNLTSGESLTRQILIGSKFFKDEFGEEPHYLWLPDVFGYSWALPQILKKAGIDMFMTTKISWNQYNRMPHDTFYWKGIDGSEVLTHFITTPEPGREAGSWFYTYNGLILPETVQGIWNAYRDKDVNQELLISYGYGDGGGGVNRDSLEQRRRIDKIPGLPHLKTSKAKDYFEKLKKNVSDSGRYVHTWDGELYLEYHRGTYTSQGYNKRMNRKMELLYRKAEWMTVMDALTSGSLAEAMQEHLTKGWKMILTNQFHDIIPGSSIREVYEDSKQNYEEISAIAQETIGAFCGHVVKASEDVYTVWNLLSWNLCGMVELPESREGVYRSGQGQVLQTQKHEESTWVYMKDVPSMGYAVVYFEEAAAVDSAEDKPFTVCERRIDTPYYSMTINEWGQIENLYDKEFGRMVFSPGACGNVLQIFEDKPLGGDAWDIDIFYQQKMREIRELTGLEVKECGSLRLVLGLEWRYGKSSISQDMILYAKDRRIEFDTFVDYHQRHQLVKAAFPVDIRANHAIYDVQYGNVKRPNHWNTSWDMARFESVAHRWVDLSERGYGVSILNDCKYGHDVYDNIMRITLLKAATAPDYDADQGEHRFTYALFPHGGDFVEGEVIQEAAALNQPFEAMAGKAELPFESFLSFDCDNVELDAVKKSEDGRYLVVRFHEFTGKRGPLKVKTGFSFCRWIESDLRERPLAGAWSESEITLDVKPYEIKTLLLSLDPS